ncbi:ATP-binding protein [Clostridium tertium]|uniref:ATP-binding protein n=1 Tax=Clostridium tertium TaxID=1559 RepID=UPI001C1E48BB|nr:ATP-binding protein [Clostridium tertium]MBU6137320.1 ATP-binding protein [Clostridium tertium]
MEALDRILSQVKTNGTNTTSSSYKCSKCKDTSWIEKDGAYTRCSCYTEEYLSRLWENFGVKIKDIKLLREYEPYNDSTKKAKDKAADYIRNFDEIKDTRENGFALLGQPGAGKTHIVLAIGKALLEKKISVVYMPYLEVIKELKALAMYQEDYEKLLSRYTRAKVLIIDDLFKDKVKKGRIAAELSETDMKHIYPILNYRYLNYLPTIISSECTPDMLLNLDEALGGRILETTGPRFSLTFKEGCNYRLRKFMKE